MALVTPMTSRLNIQMPILQADMSNWEEWNDTLQLMASIEDLLGVITGADVCPEPPVRDGRRGALAGEAEAAEIEESRFKWFKRNVQAKGLIIGGLAGPARASALRISNAAEIYKKYLESATSIRDQYVEQHVWELFNIQQAPGEGAVSFVRRLEDKIATAEEALGGGVKFPTKAMAILLKGRVLPQFQECMRHVSRGGDLTLATLSATLQREEALVAQQTTAEMVMALTTSKTPSSSLVSSSGGHKTSSSSPTIMSASSSSSPPSVTRRCVFCDKLGHSASRCNILKKERKDVQKAFYDKVSVLTINDFNDNAGDKIPSSSSPYIVDSGASRSIVSSASVLYDTKPSSCKLFQADGAELAVEREGTLNLGSVIIPGVLVSKEVKHNVLSVRSLAEQGCEVEFDDNGVEVRKNGQKLAYAPNKKGLYMVGHDDFLTSHDMVYSLPVSSSSSSTSLTASDDLTWHLRLGHLSDHGLRLLGLPADQGQCTTCLAANLQRVPVSRKDNVGHRAVARLTRVHLDLVDVGVQSVHSQRYFLHVVDCYSRYSWALPLRTKAETAARFEEWVKTMSNSCNSTVQVAHSDRGGEFTGHAFQTVLRQFGITSTMSASRTPQHNGVVERANGVVVSIMRANLLGSGVSWRLWPYVLKYAVLMRNLRFSRTLQSSPHSLFWDRPYKLSSCHPFGRNVLVLREDAPKLGSRGEEAVYLGRAHDGILAFNLRSQKVINTRNFIFPEGLLFPLTHSSMSSSTGAPSLPIASFAPSFSPSVSNPSPSTLVSPPSDCSLVLPTSSPSFPNSSTSFSCGLSPHDSIFVHQETEAAPPCIQLVASKGGQSQEVQERLARRTRFLAAQPSRIQASRARRHLHLHETASGAASVGTPDTASFATAESELSAAQIFAVLGGSESNAPRTYASAVSPDRVDRVEWESACEVERENMRRNCVFTPVDSLPPKVKALPCMWLFSYKADGRRKARLVVLGNFEKESSSKVASPVISPSSLRQVVATGVMEGLLMHTMDVDAAFLYGEIPDGEEVYVRLPDGFPGLKYCKLNRTLYGLRRAPLAWYVRVSSFLKRLGFEKSATDHCVFYLHRGGEKVILCLYVDDLLLAASSQGILESVKRALSQEFSMKDMGPLRQMLGFEFRPLPGSGLHMSQSAFATAVLERYASYIRRKFCTPLPVDLSPQQHHTTTLGWTPALFRAAIGSLMYLMIGTRPDLAFPVGYLARQVAAPSFSHYHFLSRVLGYVAATVDYGLTFRPTRSVVLRGFADADWAGDASDRKSVSGFLFQLGGNTIFWGSKKQKCVALSSAEAEYISMSEAVRQCIPLRRLTAELHPHLADSSTSIGQDNQAAMAMASGVRLPSSQTKHIDLRCRFIEDVIARGEVHPVYVPTFHMPADILTKPLARHPHEHHLSNLGVFSYSKLRS